MNKQRKSASKSRKFQAVTAKAPKPAGKRTSKAQGRAETPKAPGPADQEAKPQAKAPSAAAWAKAIAAVAEGARKKVRAEREPLDRRTKGAYSALCELERAFAAVLKVRAGEQTFYADDDAAGCDRANALEQKLWNIPAMVHNARVALVSTGFNPPKEWLTCDPGFEVGLRPPRPGRPGPWRVWWEAPPDAAALGSCLRQVGAEIMCLRYAPRKRAGGRPQAARRRRRNEAIPATDLKARMSCADLARKWKVPPNALYKRLARWRHEHAEGWYEVQNAPKGEPRIIYEVGPVLPVIQALEVKTAAADKRQATKNLKRRNAGK